MQRIARRLGLRVLLSRGAKSGAIHTSEHEPAGVLLTGPRTRIWAMQHGVDSPVRAGEAEGLIVHPATPHGKHSELLEQRDAGRG